MTYQVSSWTYACIVSGVSPLPALTSKVNQRRNGLPTRDSYSSGRMKSITVTRDALMLSADEMVVAQLSANSASVW